MADHNVTIADVLELLLINQNAIGAGLEEVTLWIGREKGIYLRRIGASEPGFAPWFRK
jgi:hypothetical protein